MRKLFAALVLSLLGTSIVAQSPPRQRPTRPVAPYAAQNAEAAIKQAMEQLASLKKSFDRDIEVLNHLQAADAALADAMQPANAIQKAYEHIVAAQALQPDFLVYQGVIRMQHELESARRSPAVADFGRLRSLLRDEALGPASRVAARNALRLQEETVAWLKVQELISAHLRVLSEIAGESLRAAQK
jgi:small-conductance mechanosensitive channel